jgi:hypothetical protein
MAHNLDGLRWDISNGSKELWDKLDAAYRIENCDINHGCRTNIRLTFQAICRRAAARMKFCDTYPFTSDSTIES